MPKSIPNCLLESYAVGIQRLSFIIHNSSAMKLGILHNRDIVIIIIENLTLNLTLRDANVKTKGLNQFICIFKGAFLCNGLKLAFGYIVVLLHCILSEEMFIDMRCPSQIKTVYLIK